MRVLVACEISGMIRDAFRRRGHAAWSIDLLGLDDIPPHWPPQEFPQYHLVGNALDWLYPTRFASQWDLLIAMPPCTVLTNSGVRWLYERGTRRKVPGRWANLLEGAALFNAFYRAKVPRIAVENPVMHRHARELVDGPPSQRIQPYQFGHNESKSTCLWLKGLPLLAPTQHVPPPYVHRVHKMGPGPWRQADRSLTYRGIAEAMAEQWGVL